MTVYPQLEANDIQTMARDYDRTVSCFTPIEAGVWNSNFFLETEQRPFILTVLANATKADAIELGQLPCLLETHKFNASWVHSSVQGGQHTLLSGQRSCLSHISVAKTRTSIISPFNQKREPLK